MLIVKLTGGLGNQLFQYAMGRAMTEQSNEELRLDINSFIWDKLRNYALSPFTLHARIASNDEIKKIKNYNVNIKDRILHKIIGKSIPYYLYSSIKEPIFSFDTNFNKYRTKNVYLEGYWQSEKYFIQIRSLLLKEINVDDSKLSITTRSLKSRILNLENSVSIHVRRGDYISNTLTSEFHGSCDLNYYKNAMNVIEQSIEAPIYFVFSDNKSYVKEMFENNENIIIVEGISFDYEELLLMSLCKHNIIANSSFSWWGAWLNQNSNKKVIAPSRWFLNNEMQELSMDLIPLNWIKI
jgi:hypothetical protein